MLFRMVTAWKIQDYRGIVSNLSRYTIARTPPKPMKLRWRVTKGERREELGFPEFHRDTWVILRLIESRIAGVKISSALCAPQQVHKEPALRRTADCGLTEGGLSLKWNRPTCERPLELLDLVLYLVSFLFRMRSWYIFIPTIRSFLLLLLLPVRESDFWFDVKFKERKRGEKEGSCFENFRELIIIFHFYYNLNSLEILFRRDCKCYNFSNISFIY